MTESKQKEIGHQTQFAGWGKFIHLHQDNDERLSLSLPINIDCLWLTKDTAIELRDALNELYPK